MRTGQLMVSTGNRKIFKTCLKMNSVKHFLGDTRDWAKFRSFPIKRPKHKHMSCQGGHQVGPPLVVR